MVAPRPFAAIVCVTAAFFFSTCYCTPANLRIHPAYHQPQTRSEEARDRITPKDEAMFLSVDERKPGQFVGYNLRHREHSYVDLEEVETYLKDGRVRCKKGAMPHEPTTLALLFNDHEPFDIARSEYGGRDDILFTVEDAGCFEGPGERSVYRSQNMTFDEARNALFLHAIPLPAHVNAKSGWVHNLTVVAGIIPKGYYTELRRSASHEDDFAQSLYRRLLHYDHIFKGDFDWGPRKEIISPTDKDDTIRNPISRPYVACLGCKMVGEIKVSLHIEFDLDNDEEKEMKRSLEEREQRARLNKIYHQVQHLVEYQRRQRHTSAVHIISKRDAGCEPGLDCHFDLFGRADYCDPDSSFWPDCDPNGNVGGRPHLESCTEEVEGWPDCDPPGEDVECGENKLLHIFKGVIGGSIKCTFKSILGDPECWQCYVDSAAEFDGFGDWFQQYLQAHMAAANFAIEVKEPVDIAMQWEVVARGEGRFFFNVDYFPPSEVTTSFGWKFNLGEASNCESASPYSFGDWTSADELISRGQATEWPNLIHPSKRSRGRILDV